MAVEGLARSLDGPAPTFEGPVPNVEGPVPTVEGLAQTMEGPVPTVDGPIRSVEGPAPALGGLGGGVSSPAAPGLPVSELSWMDSRGLGRILGGSRFVCSFSLGEEALRLGVRMMTTSMLSCSSRKDSN